MCSRRSQQIHIRSAFLLPRRSEMVAPAKFAIMADVL
jgi:hypothetical protein